MAKIASPIVTPPSLPLLPIKIHNEGDKKHLLYKASEKTVFYKAPVCNQSVLVCQY